MTMIKQHVKQVESEVVILLDLLGLEITPVDDDNVKFTFTSLNNYEPKKPHYLSLDISNESSYSILECEPHLPKQILDTLLQGLNKTDNFRAFFKGIREAFKSLYSK